MRRLPVFFLVDVSESMAGEQLYQLEEAIATIVSGLRKDPYALETVYLSVIVFAGKARTIMPLTELVQFCPPALPIGGGTALGRGLEHLMDEISRTVVTNTQARKGDWRPLIFLLTDGRPTDDVTPAVARWNRDYRRRANLVAVSIGGGADHHLLERLTDEVILFNDAAVDAFTRLTRWLSQSVQSMSRSVQAGRDGKVSLAKAESDLLAPLESVRQDGDFAGVDERYAVFIGQCSIQRLPYILKYQQHLGRIETADPELRKLLQTRHYILSGAVPVRQSYFELSDGTTSGQSVRSEDLIGQPACPHCAAGFGMAVCACGGIHCVEGEGERTCPWCQKTGFYGAASEGEGFKIDRGRG